MEDKFKDRMTYLGNKILNNSRNELYLSMRFLDIALSSLHYELYLSTVTIGTDGEKILYNPNYLIKRYQDDTVLVNRSYLHMLLHCIFRHMINAEERDIEYWNLSCDIAVESIIDSLDYKCINLTVSDKRNEIYEKLRKELKVLTAEGIYCILKKMNLSFRELKQMEKEFVSCDHSIWGRLKESTDDESSGTQDERQNKEENQEQNQEQNQEENIEQSQQQKQQENQEQQEKQKQQENQEQEQKQKEDETTKNNSNNTDEINDNSKKNNEKHKTNQLPQDNSKRVKEQQEEMNKNWKDISEKVQTNLEAMSRQIGDEAEGLFQSLKVENREKYDYKDFLRKFAVRREEMQVDMDSFDYVFYTYGLKMYGNMPFVEPLEYKEMKRIEEFIIVIDTSGSCSGELIKRFLEVSYKILTSEETFAKKVNIYIIQCDDMVQSAVNITSEADLKKYMDNFEIKGLGGTDFRPAFRYIEKLIENKEFQQLKGMLYFTDGYGIYPTKRPNFDVAFVFSTDNYTDVDVPPWAMKLLIEPGGLLDEHKKSKR